MLRLSPAISHGVILGATGGGIDLFQSPARDDEGGVLFVVVRLCARSWRGHRERGDHGRDRRRDD